MTGHSSALFQTYLRNLQRIYWIEFIEAQTELLNARSAAYAAEAENNQEQKAQPSRDCLSATYEYFRYR